MIYDLRWSPERFLPDGRNGPQLLLPRSWRFSSWHAPASACRRRPESQDLQPCPSYRAPPQPGIEWCWLVGFGMGATSAPGGERLARPRTREGYRAWLDAPPERPQQGMPVDDCLLVGLRRREGADRGSWIWRTAPCRRWNAAGSRSSRRGYRWAGRPLAVAGSRGDEPQHRVMLEVVL